MKFAFPRHHSLTSGVLLGLTLSSTLAIAQDQPGRKPRPTETPATSPATTPGAKPAPKPGDLKPYKDVVTAEAKSDPGIFTVHRIGDKILFEIPAAMLGKEMLTTTEIAQLPSGAGYGGTFAGSKVIRWTRRENKIYMRNVDYSVRAEGEGKAIRRAVESATLEPIIEAFDVQTEGKDKAAVIDVTRLYTSNPQEFSVSSALNAGGVDPGRSYIDNIKSFPTNIEVRSLLTFSGGGSSFRIVGGRFVSGNSAGAVTALVHYSMVILPEKPMPARLYDSRVGYFTESFEAYGRPENRVVNREFITRYRLEKKDPTAALSEPIKPIVYYISREVPEEWHPYIKQAVEDWQPAFEAAGFKNAIICKEAPTVAEDSNWDPEDARYSVIRWAPNSVENAMGPHTSDPRTGEILSAHVIVWHDVLKLVETWYFVQCAAQDPNARKLPMSVETIGPLMRVVLAHELGHTLGLRHNHKASSSFTVAQLRDKAFTEKWGDEASIMDYGRFNYVAQPGDGARLLPKLGPYDLFAIEWGYKPFTGYNTPDSEKSKLDEIAARQITDPTLRFGGEDLNSVSDPTVQTEDLGSDPIAATAYGLKNISRIADLLIPATTKYGEDYDRLSEMYDALLNQRLTELNHVVKLIGGVVQTDYHAGRGDAVYQPVPAAKQAQAVQFLIANGLTMPRELLAPAILDRITATGNVSLVEQQQNFFLSSLLSTSRLSRLMDNEAAHPASAYTAMQLMQDVQSGVWSDLKAPSPVIGLYRRSLQRYYLSIMKDRLTTASLSETHGISMGMLRDLLHAIDAALPKVTDTETLMHLRDCRMTIDHIVNPRV